MPFIPAPVGTTRCSLNWTQNGERCINVIYVDRQALTVQAVADLVHTSFGTNMAVGLNNNTRLEFVVATDVETATGVSRVSSGAPYVGVATAQALPNDKSACATLRTDFGGRSGRGRFYIMGLTIGDITDTDPNHLIEANRAMYETFMEDSGDAVNAGGAEFVIASYYSGVNPDGTPIPRALAVLNAVTQVDVNRRIDTQRRRLPKT